MTVSLCALERGVLFFAILLFGAHGVHAHGETHTVSLTIPLIPFIALLVLLCWCWCCNLQKYSNNDRHGPSALTDSTTALPKEAYRCPESHNTATNGLSRSVPVYTLPTSQVTAPGWSGNDEAAAEEHKRTQGYNSRDSIITSDHLDETTSTDCSHSSANAPSETGKEVTKKTTDMEEGLARKKSVDVSDEV